MRPLWLAIQFLTRLPTPQIGEPTPVELGRSQLHYPLVGLLIGGLLCLAAWPFVSIGQPLVAAAIAVTLWVGVTGALHLDGLADVADAWVGGQGDPERTLEIMKDPRSGPVAIAAVVVLLLLKFTAIAALFGNGAWLGIVAAPLLARAVLPPLLATTPYVRPNGLATVLVEQLPRHGVSWMVALVMGLTLLIGGWLGAAVVALIVTTTALLRGAFVRRIGGVTGDCLGTIVESNETVVLLWFVLMI